VERAISHYQWAVQRGQEPLALGAALDAEEQRLQGERERLLSDPSYSSYAHQHYSYKSRGIYAEQLEWWFAEFDRRSIMVLKSESLFGSPSATVLEVLEFLGLPYEDLGPLPHRNRGTGEEIDPRIREQLRAYFQPHNERLCDLLGWKEGW
jgi:hypothetical protein